MGSIRGKILAAGLAVCLSVMGMPALALADNAGQDTDVDYGQNVGEPKPFAPSGDSSTATATTNVNVKGYGSTAALTYVEDSGSATVSVKPNTNDTIWVVTSGGSGTYAIQWQRAKLTNGSESTLENVPNGTIAESDKIEGDSKKATFTHYLVNDTFDEGATYNYYYTITDTGADGRPTLSNIGTNPIKVEVGASNYFAGPVANDPWSIEGDNNQPEDNGWNGVKGDIRKEATLEVTHFDTTTSQSASPSYESISTSMAEKGWQIAGTNSTATPPAKGTAAWHVKLVYNGDPSETVDLFRGDVKATLTLDADDLAGLGLLDGSGNLLDDYAHLDGSNIAFMGGANVAMSDEKVEVTKDANGKPVLTVSFTVEGKGGAINTGDFGVIALVCPIKGGTEGTYTITPKVGTSGGTIDPSVLTTFVDGTSGTFDFIPTDKSHELKRVSIHFEGTLVDAAGDPVLDASNNPVTSPWVFTKGDKFDRNAGTFAPLTNSFTFDESLTGTGSGWATDAEMVVDFGPIETSPAKTHNVTIYVADGGTVSVDGTAVTNGATLPLTANENHTLTFAPADNYKPVLKGGTSADDATWTDIAVSGSTYSTGLLNSDRWYSVTWEPRDPDREVEHTVSCEYLPADGSLGTVSLGADGLTSKKVEHGYSVTFIVSPAEGCELASATPYYGTQEGTSLMGNYDASSHALTIDTVTQDTNVRFVFKKTSSTGGDQPSGPVVPEEPTTGKISIAGITTMDGTDITDKCSTTLDASTDFVIGTSQKVGFFYKDSPTGEYWVINTITVTDKKSGSTITYTPIGGVNYATIDVTGPDMEISVTMRAPESSDKPIDPPAQPDIKDEVPPVTGGDVTGNQTVKDPITGDDVDTPVVAVTPTDPTTGEVLVDPTTNKPYEPQDIIIDPNDPNKAYTDPDTGQISGRDENNDPIINPATQRPYVDKEGNIVGDGGFYDKADDVWDPLITVAPRTVYPWPNSGGQTIDVWATNSDDYFFYSTIEKLSVNGVDVLPYKENDLFEPMEGYDNRYKLKGGDGWFEVDLDAAEVHDAITFHDIDKTYSVTGVSEPTVNVSFTSKGNGSVSRTSETWKPFKLSGDTLKLLLIPNDGEELIKYTVNGHDRLAKLRDATEANYQDVMSAGRLKTSSTEDDLIARLFKLFDASDSSDGDGSDGGSGGNVTEIADLGVDGSDDDVLTEIAKLFEVEEAHAAPSGLKAGSKYDEFAANDESSIALCSNAQEMKKTKTMQVYTEYSTKTGDTPTNPGGDTPTNPGGDKPQPLVHNIHVEVLAGNGYVENKDAKWTKADIPVENGGKCTIHFYPEAGFQVVSLVVDDVETAYTLNELPMIDVTEPHTIGVKFGMIGAAGDNSAGTRAVRRITSMLNTGDISMPLMFAALGVALGAAGVAFTINNRNRRKAATVGAHAAHSTRVRTK